MGYTEIVLALQDLSAGMEIVKYRRCAQEPTPRRIPPRNHGYG